MLAAEKGNCDIVKMMLVAGADANKVDKVNTDSCFLLSYLGTILLLSVLS